MTLLCDRLISDSGLEVARFFDAGYDLDECRVMDAEVDENMDFALSAWK